MADTTPQKPVSKTNVALGAALVVVSALAGYFGFKVPTPEVQCPQCPVCEAPAPTPTATIEAAPQ